MAEGNAAIFQTEIPIKKVMHPCLRQRTFKNTVKVVRRC